MLDWVKRLEIKFLLQPLNISGGVSIIIVDAESRQKRRVPIEYQLKIPLQADAVDGIDSNQGKQSDDKVLSEAPMNDDGHPQHQQMLQFILILLQRCHVIHDG